MRRCLAAVCHYVATILTRWGWTLNPPTHTQVVCDNCGADGALQRSTGSTWCPACGTIYTLTTGHGGNITGWVND